MAPFDYIQRPGTPCSKCGDTDCVCPDDEGVYDGVVTICSDKAHNYTIGQPCPICGDSDCVCPDEEGVYDEVATILSNKARNHKKGEPCPICKDTDCVCPVSEVTEIIECKAAIMLCKNELNYSSGWNGMCW